MDLVQVWIVVGVPMLTIAAGLFVGRSRARAWAGYGVIVALMVILAFTPGGGISAAAVGLIGTVFVATGRGTRLDERYAEHHEERRAYTVAGNDTH